jgi:hypothetical protein
VTSEAWAGTRIPLALKLAVTVWLVVWVPVYWRAHGPQNFLWFCDLANFLIAAALWTGSRLLFSSQAIAVLAAQILWVLDVVGRLALGLHPIGGTEYMFDAATPLALRLMSLFHVAALILLVWGVRRLGYDARGLPLQLAIAAVILPVSWLFGPGCNLNWTWGPFGGVQQALPPLLYLALLPFGYLLVLYLPTHWALRRWVPLEPADRLTT